MLPAKKVVVITEKVLHDRLVDFGRSVGAVGYTSSLVNGSGYHGTRTGALSGHGDVFSNVKIEFIVPPEVATKIVDGVMATYFNDYAGIVYTEDVEVVRPKF
jgi:nitrogen regulatory protein PII